MIARARRYHQNTGIQNSLTTALLLAYLMWVQFQYQSTILNIVAPAVLACCFVVPFAIVGLCEKNPYLTNQIIRYARFAIFAFFIVSIFNLIDIHPLLFIPALLAFVFLMGAEFWFLSSPNIRTARGYRYDHEQMLAAEEAYLQEELATAEAELNDSNSRPA